MIDSSPIEINITSLWQAWTAFRRGKIRCSAIEKFEENLEENLITLHEEFVIGTYQHGGYVHRQVHEKKRRDIFVADIRDRVVHRLLYDYVVPVVDPHFDYDVWSCRKNKGLHGCIERTITLLNRYPQAYIWRADVKKFFDSVPHGRLLETVHANVACPKSRELLGKVISSYSSHENNGGGVGLSIGNLTSQILANMYFDLYDRHVRHFIKPLAYLRYGDDFILVCTNAEQADIARTQGRTQLHQLGLTVNPSHDVIVQSFQGLHFLGHIINRDGATIMTKTRKRMLSRINEHNFASYVGMNLDADTRQLIGWFGSLNDLHGAPY